MKAKIVYIFLGMCSFLFTACNIGGPYTHPDLVGKDPKGGKICFFQFKDTSYLNKIILWKADPGQPSSKYGKRLGNKYWMPLYPKNFEGEPVFGEIASGTDWDFMFMEGEFYTIEDLVNSPKFIALKGGYYICYPFTSLELYGHYIDAEWKDFYKTDFYNAEICSHFPYKIRYNISERALANLTKKSTMHFKRENADMITIDDVVETLNKLIETNSIDKYCYQVYN
jgi:hypothetical protein